jgi:hypothetical protein
MTVTLLLLALGATARITRFFNADVLAGSLRAAVVRRYGDESKAATLIRCPWCLSPYVAVPVLGSGLATHSAGWWEFLAAVLSISYVYALAAQWLDDE